MFEKITLEMSLKPFKKTDINYLRKVCKKVFTKWRPLLENRKTISIMLWVGDGSEILDYSGKQEDSFEWARFIGTANLPYPDNDTPLETSLHVRKRDYINNPPKMTYGILKTIVSLIKEEGKKAFPDSVILVGETFDIGPEFAISDFKYNRHREICSGSTLDSFGFVDSTAKLHSDKYAYASYPDGIPEGTSFGTFLGNQSRCFLKDMGFDYLWLSNGLGFSTDPWLKTGKIFDGEKYYPEKLYDVKNKVFEFWKLFRQACPDIPLETRGTNNSVGIDYASDGVPLYEIYNAELDMPDSCINEPIPHLLKAEKNIIDEAAPLVWIYPMREYTTSNDSSLLKEMNNGDNFICDAINDGFPLCCVTSTDSFLRHKVCLYSKSTIISPVPVNDAVLDKLINFADSCIKILIYGTPQALSKINDFKNITKINIENGCSQLREAFKKSDYTIDFIKKQSSSKPPTLALSYHNNALMISAYNPNTTTDTLFKFPMGAPILCGCETELINGHSSYRFSRSEHRECRIFINQQNGVISCREAPPVNARFRRSIKIEGLENATINLLTEKDCECAVSISTEPDYPILDNRFKLIGDRLTGENISGSIYFLIGYKGSI